MAGERVAPIDEQLSRCVREKVVAFAEKDCVHRCVIGDDGKDGVRVGRDLGKGLRVGAVQFLGKRGSNVLGGVVYAADLITFVLEVAGHVGAHAANPDQTDSFLLGAHS